MDAAAAGKKQLRRVRTLGSGASGAVVWLASDDASGELLAVKSAGSPVAAEQLAREARVLSGLSSPHVVPCLGVRAGDGGEYQLFLQFAPGGSLADVAARSGGRLSERETRAYAADVARGLAYLHGLSLVHGDVKARNVECERHSSVNVDSGIVPFPARLLVTEAKSWNSAVFVKENQKFISISVFALAQVQVFACII
ncbi:hypothetical protein PR202_ga10003 [Eleusine coracana subsp. coracana]|uniref:Protein kinase domain-containing protein n=1 Tax=Eleusine coracana subsp. coracana TaxID=191504 RepID=A0AAV5C5I1_ELECO|nr:hypothetical protein PR202_ga10003 [Eleusine coracana subsp. coracana]